MRPIAAKMCRGRGELFDDLVSAGYLGLIDAAERYDDHRGSSFARWADLRIKGAMVDYLREIDPLTRDMRRHAKAIRKARDAVEGGGLEAVAAEMGITIQELDVLRTKSFAAILDLDDPDYGFERSLPDPLAADPLAAVVKRETFAALLDAISNLSFRSQLILDLAFGHELTQREIAEIIGVTESRISQVIQEDTETLAKDPKLREGHS